MTIETRRACRPRELNPVIGRELTERLRGLRAFVALSIFVLLLTLTAFLVFEGVAGRRSRRSTSSARTRVGRLVFESVMLIMTVLVLFFVPGVCGRGHRRRARAPDAGDAAGDAAAAASILRRQDRRRPRLPRAADRRRPARARPWPTCSAGSASSTSSAASLAVVAVALLVATMVVAVSTFAKRVQTATVLAYAVTALLRRSPGRWLFGVGSRARRPHRRRRPRRVGPPAVLLAAQPDRPRRRPRRRATSPSGDGPLSAHPRRDSPRPRSDNDGSWFALFPDAEPRRADGGSTASTTSGRLATAALPAWVLAAVVDRPPLRRGCCSLAAGPAAAHPGRGRAMRTAP